MTTVSMSLVMPKPDLDLPASLYISRCVLLLGSRLWRNDFLVVEKLSKILKIFLKILEFFKHGPIFGGNCAEPIKWKIVRMWLAMRIPLVTRTGRDKNFDSFDRLVRHAVVHSTKNSRISLPLSSVVFAEFLQGLQYQLAYGQIE